MKKNAVLLLYCQDRKGIVSKISNFIFNNNGNILKSDQHSDIETNTFFMRIEWDMNNFNLDKKTTKKNFQEQIANDFHIHFTLNFTEDKKNIAIFVSQHEHCILDLLVRFSLNELDGTVKLIISNHRNLSLTRDCLLLFTYYKKQ